MSKRLLFVAASLAALSACGSRETANNSQMSNSTTTTTTNSATTPTPMPGGGMPANSAQLEQGLQQAVTMIRPRLPLRQQTPNGTITISNIEANGTELVFTMQVPMDLDATSFQRMEQALPVQACANPQARQLLSMGGAYTYHVVDSGGEQFSTSVRSCPGA